MEQTEPPKSFLETLRISRGVTQVQLAAATGISQAALSKVESGTAGFDEERWAIIAKELGVPVSAFTDANAPLETALVFHRKRKSTPKAALNKIAADLALTRRRVESIVGCHKTSLKRHDLEDGYYTAGEIARKVRKELGLGDRPVPDLVAELERANVTVLRWPLESLQVDAIAAWPSSSAPVILVGEHVPAERQRFTMAHELGHAVLHDSEATDAQEREADDFAAEFLFPAKQVVKEWVTNPELEDLYPIKRKWGISLAALIRRGYDCNLLDDREYRSWNVRLSSTGMHRREPAPLPPEDPKALREAIAHAEATGVTVELLAERAHMHPTEFAATFMEEIA
jgi:Zn-dependent peptidase ImmA (M78 family)/DNA-binding XRE family transcriptional regulator